MATDTITLDVLEDGTARIIVGNVAGPNHVRADALVKEFAKLMGGDLTVNKNPKAHSHTHQHDHVHTGQGGDDHDHE
jgi:hypothetical protein